MGFFDNIADKFDDAKRSAKRFRRYDDDRIKWIVQNSSGFRKMAAMSVLKERGYDFRG